MFSSVPNPIRPIGVSGRVGADRGPIIVDVVCAGNRVEQKARKNNKAQITDRTGIHVLLVHGIIATSLTRCERDIALVDALGYDIYFEVFDIIKLFILRIYAR